MKRRKLFGLILLLCICAYLAGSQHVVAAFNEQVEILTQSARYDLKVTEPVLEELPNGTGRFTASVQCNEAAYGTEVHVIAAFYSAEKQLQDCWVSSYVLDADLVLSLEGSLPQYSTVSVYFLERESMTPIRPSVCRLLDGQVQVSLSDLASLKETLESRLDAQDNAIGELAQKVDRLLATTAYTPELFASAYGVVPGDVDMENMNQLLTAASEQEKTIRFDDGTYMFPSTIEMQSNTSIVGSTNTIFRLQETSTAEVLMKVGEMADNVYISHLILMGSFASMPTKQGTKTGMEVTRAVRVNIENVEICGFDRYGFYSSYMSSNQNGDFYKMLQITNCRFYNNYFGMCLGPRCEYTQTLNCVFGDNYIGCLNQGGNNSYVSCIFNKNHIGFQMDSEGLSNPAHGGCNSCTFNHNDTAIIVNDCKIGWIFNGCQIFYGKVCLNVSQGVIFNSCIFGSCTINSINPTQKDVNLISDCFFQTERDAILAGNDGSTLVTSCLPYDHSESDPSDCSVVFVSNGGTELPAQTVRQGETLNRPAAPTKKYHAFVDWYTDPACTMVYRFEMPVTSSMTLYAKWELLPDADLNDEVTWTQVAYTQPATVATAASVDAYFGVLSCPVPENTSIDFIDIALKKITSEGQQIDGVDLWIGNASTGELVEHLVEGATMQSVYSDRMGTYVLRIEIEKQYDFPTYFVMEATRTAHAGIAYGHSTSAVNYFSGKTVFVGDVLRPNSTYIPEFAVYSRPQID